MKKNLMIGGLVVFIIGLIVLWVSPTWGISLADSYLHANDEMDHEAYIALANNYASSIRLAGGIIAFLGGLEAILAFYFYPSPNVKNEDVTLVPSENIL